MGGGMMGGMGGAKKKKGKSQEDREREAKEEEDASEEEARGQARRVSDKAEDAETPRTKRKPRPKLPSKEITKGYRWVVVTGVLDHAKLIANYREALKNPAVAHPNYRRLDLQRQTLQADGSWTKWETVSHR